MTLIGLVFVIGGGWGISQGSLGLGIAAVLFFGACLLYGIINWWSIEAELRGVDLKAADGAFGIAIVGIAALLGLGCLAMFVVSLIGWSQFGFATTVRYPRILVLVASAAGVVLFLGGSIALVIRKGRPFGIKSADSEDTTDPDDEA